MMCLESKKNQEKPQVQLSNLKELYNKNIDLTTTASVSTNGSILGADLGDATLKPDYRPPKIVVLTDGFGKYIFQPLKKTLGSKFSVQVFSKPYAPFKEVVSTIDCLAESLTHKDYVIVLTGLLDSNIRIRDITYLANKCFYTNVLFCTIPINLFSKNLITSKTQL